MKNNLQLFPYLLLTFTFGLQVLADEVQSTVDLAVKALGGSDKILKTYEFDEAFTLGKNDRVAKRHSMIDGVENWFLPTGKNRKDDTPPEPARYLAWAWSGGMLVDSKSKFESIPSKDDKLVGIKVSESVTPAMELYFDKKTSLLQRIEWRETSYVFSEHQPVAGTVLAMRCVATKANGAPFVAWDGSKVKRLDSPPSPNPAPSATKSKKKAKNKT